MIGDLKDWQQEVTRQRDGSQRIKIHNCCVNEFQILQVREFLAGSTSLLYTYKSSLLCSLLCARGFTIFIPHSGMENGNPLDCGVQ